jgi:chromate transporter
MGGLVPVQGDLKGGDVRSHENRRSKLLRSLFLEFLKLGAFTFGGGYAMIPLIEREIVRKRGWLSSEDFADLVAIAEMTPGSLIIKSSTFVGKRVSGILGSVIATLAVTLPPFLVFLALAATFLRIVDFPATQSVFKGVDAAIVALVVVAILSLGKTSISDKKTLLIATGTVIAVFVFGVHPIFALLAAGVVGLVLFR